MEVIGAQHRPAEECKRQHRVNHHERGQKRDHGNERPRVHDHQCARGHRGAGAVADDVEDGSSSGFLSESSCSPPVRHVADPVDGVRSDQQGQVGSRECRKSENYSDDGAYERHGVGDGQERARADDRRRFLQLVGFVNGHGPTVARPDGRADRPWVWSCDGVSFLRTRPLVLRYQFSPSVPSPGPGPRNNAGVTLPKHWSTPSQLRTLAYGVAIAIALMSPVTGFGDAQFYYFGWAWVAAPAALVAAAVVRSGKHRVFAAAAFIVAACNTTEAAYLGFAVFSLVLLSLVEDPSQSPAAGWASGVVGGALSLFLEPGMNVAPFAATVLAFIVAMLVRALTRGSELASEAEQLRGQAIWLEQRTALARELHDVVGHHVTAMVVQAEAGQVAEAVPALRRIADTGRAALRELDALVVHLRDPDAAISVSAPPHLGDIDEILAEPLRQHGVTVDVDIDENLGLDETGSLAVYRVTQEALTNVTRHAKACHAWVEVRRVARQVRLRVSDDGIGPPTHVARGAGLVGITERVAALNGSFEMTSRPGGGTMVVVELPVAEA